MIRKCELDQLITFKAKEEVEQLCLSTVKIAFNLIKEFALYKGFREASKESDFVELQKKKKNCT